MNDNKLSLINEKINNIHLSNIVMSYLSSNLKYKNELLGITYLIFEHTSNTIYYQKYNYCKPVKTHLYSRIYKFDSSWGIENYDPYIEYMNNRMNVGALKRLTGNDMIYVRSLII
jgi:hypothetical protein